MSTSKQQSTSDNDDNNSTSENISHSILKLQLPSSQLASKISLDAINKLTATSAPNQSKLNLSVNNRRCKHRNSSSELDQEARESRLQEAKVYRELLPSNLIIR